MKKAKIVLLILALVFISGIIYAIKIEPHWIKIKTSEIQISNRMTEQSEIRIVHLTDFHLSSDVSLDYLRSVFIQAAAQHPDIICLTGDYVTGEIIQKSEYINVLKILSSAAPTFACPGNHDGGIWARERGGSPNVEDIRLLIQSAGITFLENNVSEIKIGKSKLMLAGLGDIWAGRCFPDQVQESLDTAKVDLRIILTHNPDSKNQTKKLKWDLILAGHTHGGQFELPFVGTPFAPVRDQKYVNGQYEYNGGILYVSPGIGNLHGVRFNCRPEISVLYVKF